MIKRLDQFVSDAAQVGWLDFSKKNQDCVLVILPQGATASDMESTTEFATVGSGSRPKINEEYRVGIIRKTADDPSVTPFVTVGRGKTCDIVLSDIEVSKFHAYFDPISSENGWSIGDAGSTNGTFVNDVRVPTGRVTPIRSSDMIRLGTNVCGVFFSPGDFYHFLRSKEVRASFT